MITYKTCCIILPKEIPAEIKGRTLCDELSDRLENMLRRLCVYYKVRVFFVGGSMGFDTLANLAVLELRKEEPGISVYKISHSQKEFEEWNPLERKLYNILDTMSNDWSPMTSYDKEYDVMIADQTKAMLEKSDFCLCYLTEDSPAYIVEQIQKVEERGIFTFNLADPKWYKKMGLEEN